MRNTEQWIWLPENLYPQCQTTMYDRYKKDYKRNYIVAEFKKDHGYEKEISSVSIRFSADTSAVLYCNDKFIGRVPASSGGDFLNPQLPSHQHYATTVTLTDFNADKLSFYAVVRMSESRLFEFSKGHGGFFLTAHITFTDGSKELLITDESWWARYLPEYNDSCKYDNTVPKEPWVNAERIKNIWYCEDSPIPPCTENIIDMGKITIEPKAHINTVLPLDMIYAGYPVIKADQNINVKIMCRELREDGTEISCRFCNSGIYEAKELHSAGELVINAQNPNDFPATLDVSFITSCYPVEIHAETKTSDSELNRVLCTCAHTLQYCRQTLHLDSPRHCELLACTGDYYIESLMTAFTFGDHRLSAFDVRRTAELLRYRNGEMFHVTYSLIWVQMLWDIYQFTGEKALLTDCEDALILLLRRFRTYIGDTGLIETPPSFMFIDWLYIDGITMHHPPKALGQTCLNMFYYGALKTTAKIHKELGLPTDSVEKEIQNLHKAILTHLYDSERGLFFEGLNTPSPEHMIHEDMPQNIEKRYYLKHSSILAAYFGFFDKDNCRELLKRVIADKTMPEPQPYFCHFLLEAIYRNDLRDEFTLSILNQWKAPVNECPKGLVEGFYKPDPSYSFDHSHAWGGTPAWSLPLALTGLEILEPGMKKIRLNPSLLGLEYADIQLPTQYGMVTVSLRQGNKPVISSPDGVEVIIK